MEELKNLDSLKDIVNNRFESFKEKTAFIEKNAEKDEYEKISYSKVKEEINGLGTYMLNELNLKGEKIAIVAENSYKWYVTYMAVICGVGVVVPIDRNLPENEILNNILSSKPKAIVYSNRTKEKIDAIKGSIPGDTIFIQINARGRNDDLKYEDIVKKGIKIVDSGNESYISAKIDREAFAALLYTSGTSQKSKGVMLSHKNLCANIYAASCIVPSFENYTSLSILPMHHPYEFTIDYLYMSAIGGTIAISQGLKYMYKELQEIHPDCMLVVPVILEKMNIKIEKEINQNGKERRVKVVKSIANGMSRIGIDIRRNVFSYIQEKFGGNLKYIFCGAAPIDASVITKMSSYGFKFIEGYGLTECGPLVAAGSLKQNNAGTVGKAVEGVEIRIDLSKNENENNNIGEIIVCGDNVMLGYYENEEQTKKTIKKGWLYTGDLGYFNLRGELVITGRSKNMILTSNGKNIYPEELEKIINKLPLIKESMVYGKQIRKNSRELMMSVRITIDEEEIKEKFKNNIPNDEELYNIILEEIKRINRMMPTYKMLRNIEIKKTDFVKSGTMKIMRNEEIKYTKEDELITGDVLQKKRRRVKKVVNVKATKK